ncbi:hypothetical protein ANANG_G00295820 [Anguilla anguilla]|uniref:Uncharacterized protein n=1 Tax=Anguilla anguilla TaxID=7936 RepID=A0A9D3RJL2_ANGAN|nr:hypothetical protein ANANG_G00295820 [Anguilla anguilla]
MSTISLTLPLASIRLRFGDICWAAACLVLQSRWKRAAVWYGKRVPSVFARPAERLAGLAGMISPFNLI